MRCTCCGRPSLWLASGFGRSDTAAAELLIEKIVAVLFNLHLGDDIAWYDIAAQVVQRVLGFRQLRSYTSLWDDTNQYM